MADPSDLAAALAPSQQQPPPARGPLQSILDWFGAQPSAAQQSMQAHEAAAQMPFAERLKYIMSNDPIAQSFGVGNMRPYGNVPDSLMGFRKTGPNVGFNESNYPHTQPVKITLPNGEVFNDEIKGMNLEHALERARRNWEGSTIEALPATANER